MRVVTGKQIVQMNALEAARWAGKFQGTIVDLGAGDGRFVQALARQQPGLAAIGIDLIANRMRRASRTAGGNALFVVADALALPAELHGLAQRVTINFPWGSLLHGLLEGHAGLLTGLRAVGCRGASIEVLLNAGALAEAGWTLEAGASRVVEVLHGAEIVIAATRLIGPGELRQARTTWGKRLAFGRDPRAVRIAATLGAPGSEARSNWAWDRAPNRFENPQGSAWLCYSPRLAGTEPVLSGICEPFCSAGRVSAQPHPDDSGASPQEGGLVARAGTRAPQI